MFSKIVNPIVDYLQAIRANKTKTCEVSLPYPMGTYEEFIRIGFENTSSITEGFYLDSSMFS